MKRKRLGLTGAYMIGICVLLLAANVSLGLMLTDQSRDALKTLIQNRMLDISNTAADMLDGDALKRLRAEDEQTPEYQAALRTLTYFQDNIELKYIYCIRDAGDGGFMFTVDPTVEDPGEFGEPIVYTDALYRASLGTSAVDDEPYEDKWGRFYSAYSPVFDSAGGVAGIVAVDFSADWYEQQLSNQRRTVSIASALSLVIGALIVILVTSRQRRRFRLLYGKLNDLSNGIEALAREVAVQGELPAPSEPDGQAGDSRGDDINAIGDKIRLLQNTLSQQIAFVRAQAYLDGLSGLGNRTAYLDEVERLDARIEAGDAAFAVAVFDLNGLKQINDTQGHEKGDRVIAEAGALLRAVFPEGKLYRIGGDEFVALLDKTDIEMQALFREFDRALVERNERGDAIAMSKGYAVYDRAVDLRYRMVFNRADDAMYADKAAYYRTHADRRRRSR